MSVPSLATAIERRALRQAAIQAGAREASLIEAPLAAAIGLGMPIQDPVGSAVVLAPTVVEMLKCSLASALGRTAGLSEIVLARTVDRGRLVEIEVSAELVNSAAHDILQATMRMTKERL